MSSRRIKIAMVLVAFSACILFELYHIGLYKESDRALCISEVCTRNLSVVCNDNKEYPSGWIELQNVGKVPIDLSEWKVPVGRGMENTAILPHEELAPGEFTLIFADEDLQADKNGISIRADLYKENSAICLSNENDVIVDSVWVPDLEINTSYSKNEETDSFRAMTCTPYAPNRYGDLVETETIAPPRFSAESGFYQEDFSLQLTCDQGEEIYYTLDGSVPTRDSILYTGELPITDASKYANIWSVREDLSIEEYTKPAEPIDKATIITAVCYDSEGNKSDIITKTYFVGNAMKEKYGSNVATISLVAEPEDLFGYENGILVLGEIYDQWLAYLGDEPENRNDYHIQANFNERGRKWEIESGFQFFEEGKFAFEQKIGLRERGRTSNRGAQKGLLCVARDIYDGNSKFVYDIWKNGRENKKLVLKNINGIWRDDFLSEMLNGTNLATQNCRPVHVFLNGEYWGLYNLMEKYDERYFSYYYNVEADNVAIFNNEEYANVDDALDEHSIEKLIEYAETHDLSKEENYTEICKWIDLDSFIDYYIVQIYIDSYDCSELYNVLTWKTRTVEEGNVYADGKWRWVLYDIDSSLRDYELNNMIERPKEELDPFCEHTILKALLCNSEFEDHFKKRFCEIMDEYLNADKVVPEFEKNAAQLYDAMEMQRERFPERLYRASSTSEEIEGIIEFYTKRRSYMEKYLSDYFGEDITQYYE